MVRIEGGTAYKKVSAISLASWLLKYLRNCNNLRIKENLLETSLSTKKSDYFLTDSVLSSENEIKMKFLKAKQ